MESNTRSIYAEIRIDWEDYDDVMDELVLEDAIESVKDGVEIYVIPDPSILIHEHQLMKEALERIQNSMQRFDFRKCARETLKQITL